MNSSSNLHVIFGTGPVGRWTMHELVQQGQRVRMVNRSGRADVPQGVEVVRADANDPTAAQTAAAGASVVYQCAQPEYHKWAEEFPPLQASILGAAATAGARLIVCDNLYMYGDPQGQTITEDLPYRAHTRKGKVRQAMAEAVLTAHQSGRVRAAIGRASDFFGPYDRVQGEQLFLPALAGKPANLLGNIDQPHSFTYVKDFGRALATLGLHEKALGQVWIAPTPAPVTQRQIAQWVGAAVGQPVKTRAAGKLLLSLFGLFSKPAGEIVEMLYEFEKPFVVSSAKFERAFGWGPTPTEAAVNETVEWFRQHQP